MVYLFSPSVIVPEYGVSADETLAGLERACAGRCGVDELSALVKATKVERRHIIMEVERLTAGRSMTERSREYHQAVVALGGKVLRCCVGQGGSSFEDVDFLVTVSSTGFMVPSLDAYLVAELGMRGDVKRLPITAAGCCGGINGAEIAADYVRANGGLAAVVAVELPSLCLQPSDLRRENIIASALFGDGAGACMVSGSRKASGLELIASRSHLIPNTMDRMRFVLGDDGFSIVLSRQVPVLVKRHLRCVVDDFLGANSVSLREVGFYVVHPGGPKVIEAVEAALSLEGGQLELSWDVLRRVGNTSSASIFFVMHELFTRRRPQDGQLGLVVAMGPGFGFELMLVSWHAGIDGE